MQTVEHGVVRSAPARFFCFDAVSSHTHLVLCCGWFLTLTLTLTLTLNCLLCPPSPDKGTVQKVIVLPSNDSLHEDLILEELEVFKVSRLLSLTFITFFSAKSKGKKGGKVRREERGELGQDTKGERAEPIMAGGIQELAVIAGVWSDGKHAGKRAHSKSQVVARATLRFVFDEGVISL